MADTPHSPEYEHRNFSAVNAYVDGVSDAVRERVRASNARRFRIYAKYSALVIAALGLSVLLVLWGMSFLKEPKVVTETKIVEKPVAFKPIIHNNITNPSAFDATRSAAEKNIDELASGTGLPAAVFNYTIFRTIPFEKDGLQGVIVGMNFEKAGDHLPSYQYCYVVRSTSQIFGHSERVDLAGKRGDASVVNAKLTSEHSRRLNVSLITLRSAQNRCEFK